MAGQKTVGAIQMAVAVFGALLAVGGFVWFFASWFQSMDQPSWFGREAMVGWEGLGILAFSWVWSLASSVVLLRGTVPYAE